jgi:hypothetical protein
MASLCQDTEARCNTSRSTLAHPDSTSNRVMDTGYKQYFKRYWTAFILLDDGTSLMMDEQATAGPGIQRDTCKARVG